MHIFILIFRERLCMYVFISVNAIVDDEEKNIYKSKESI